MGLFIGLGGDGTRPTFSYDYYYGVEIDTSTAATAGTRLGRPELHFNLPIQKKMKRCVLKDAGSVAYYLGETDSTKTSTGGSADLTGASGQVMVEIPKHYRRFEYEGTKIRCLLSEYALPGFTEVPLMYVSAYEAAVDRTNNKLSSVVNATAQYRGGGNQSDWDTLFKTQLGRPATAISLTSFRSLARARGGNWNCYTYEAHKTLFWLFTVEYNTLNSQAAYNAEVDANGYRQGGLGDGLTTMANWDVFGYYPVMPCGVTNSLGNKTGVVSYTVKKSDDGSLASQTVSVPSYRGVENPFGHVWKWTDGVLFLIQSANDGGESRVYVAKQPSDYNSTDVSNYRYAGNLPRSEGWMKTILFGEFGDMLPASVGGSSTTYWSDYFYTNIPTSGVATRGLLLGGGAGDGSLAGLGFTASYPAPSDSDAGLGSRLCFIP